MDMEKIEFLFQQMNIVEQLEAFEILTREIKSSVIWDEKMKDKEK